MRFPILVLVVFFSVLGCRSKDSGKAKSEIILGSSLSDDDKQILKAYNNQYAKLVDWCGNQTSSFETTGHLGGFVESEAIYQVFNGLLFKFRDLLSCRRIRKEEDKDDFQFEGGNR